MLRPETVKLLKENIEENLLALVSAMIVLILYQSTGNKCKNKWVGQHQTKKFHSSIGGKQNEKATYIYLIRD